MYLHIQGCRLILDVHHNKCVLASNLEETLSTKRRSTGNDLFEQIEAGIYMQMTPFSEHIKKMIELSMTNGDAPILLSQTTVKMLIRLITNFIPIPLFSKFIITL